MSEVKTEEKTRWERPESGKLREIFGKIGNFGRSAKNSELDRNNYGAHCRARAQGQLEDSF